MDSHRVTGVTSGQLALAQAPSTTTFNASSTPQPQSLAGPSTAASTSSTGDEDDDDDLVSDSRRNWSNDVTLTLVRIWKRVCQAQPKAGRVARMQAIYDEFKEAVDCSNRSIKAVEDKLYTIKQMYQFIVKMNGTVPRQQHQAQDQKNTPTWFTLTKDERRAVRSLHRVRIPNISLEVYQELDSVLNPELLLTPQEKQLKQQINQIFNQGQADAAPGGYVASLTDQRVGNEDFSVNRNEGGDAETGNDADNVDIIDAKRNWSFEVTLQLAKAWHAVIVTDGDIRGVTLSQRVYAEFMKAVGGCSRSRKAVEDKMHSMKEMYRFITSYNASCTPGSGKTPWYELKKPERRQLKALHKIRVPNLTDEIYTELAAFMKKPSDPGTPVTASLAMGSTQPISMAPTVSQVAATPSSVESDPTAFDRTGLPSESADMTLASSYEILRRLADEESRLSPAPFGHTAQPTYQQSLQQTYQQPRLNNSISVPYEPTITQQQYQQDTEGMEPPAKRSRPNEDASNDQRVQELLTLQRQALVERRQHHAEQMAVLSQILGLLQRQTHHQL